MANADDDSTSTERIGLPFQISDLPPPRHQRSRSQGRLDREPRVIHIETADNAPEVAEDQLPRSHRRRSTRRRRSEQRSASDDECDPAHDEQDANDVYNEYVSGPARPSATRPQRQSRWGTYGPSPYAAQAQNYSSRIYDRYDHGRPPRPPQDTAFVTQPPSGKRTGLWLRAAQPVWIGDHRRRREQAILRLVVTRRGERFWSKPFKYTTNSYDAHFAHLMTTNYRSLKTWKFLGGFQAVFAYKTIAFLYFLQSRCRLDLRGREKTRWQVEDRVPVTSNDDDKARDSFMYNLRYPQKHRRAWTSRLDALVVEGAIVDIEVIETFNTTKIYWALVLAVLLSLGASLAYGFAMNNDFSTGFSIGSWMITAFGFFAAVVAAGEYFGMEKPTSFQVGAGLENGEEYSD